MSRFYYCGGIVRAGMWAAEAESSYLLSSIIFIRFLCLNDLRIQLAKKATNAPIASTEANGPKKLKFILIQELSKNLRNR
jgi:hypothetical protein